MTRLRALLLALLAGLALVGCDAGSRIVVAPDGSGTYAVVLSAPSGEGDVGEALYTALQKASARSRVPLTVERFSSDGKEGAEASFSFRSLPDLRAQAAAMGETGNALKGVDFRRDDDGWHFTGSSAEGLVRQPGQTQTGRPGGSIDASGVAAMVNMSVELELPGAPGATNATDVRRGTETTTFRWDLPAGREAKDLQASTTYVGDQASVTAATALTELLSGSRDSGSGPGSGSGSGSGPGPILGIGIAAALAAVAGGLLLLRRRSGPGPAPA